ncbi:MAG: ParB/RepB/Spo0J family partition protein [Alphaproteobacteria bacterium]|nr:ParB/RepB/Spo0J family partition protein [Alphaproteobacteria bacterium]
MKAKDQKLGMGLKAFFENNAKVAPVFEAPVSSKPVENIKKKPGNSEIVYIDINKIYPSAGQPRKHFDDQALSDLARSIKETGLLQPILVRSIGADKYEIIAGERRWRAARLAKLAEIPTIIKNIDDRQSFEIGIIENIQRENLSPIEEAQSYARLIKEFGYTQETIGGLIKKSRSYIANILRLLSLPVEVQKMVDEGKIPYTTARTLIGQDNSIEMARKFVSGGTTSHEAEKIAAKKKGRVIEKTLDPAIISIEDNLNNKYKDRVNINYKHGKGEIVIRFNNLEELDKLVMHLGKINNF